MLQVKLYLVDISCPLPSTVLIKPNPNSKYIPTLNLIINLTLNFKIGGARENAKIIRPSLKMGLIVSVISMMIQKVKNITTVA